jgi:alcohol dehydrogenase class IV
MIADFVQQPVPATVHFGDGRVDDLAAVLPPESERVLVACGESVSETDLPAAVAEALGDRYAATWTGVRPHTPADTVRSAVAAVEANGADTVLALGGGSAVDTCKAASAVVVTGRDVDDLFDEELPREDAGLRHVAVPTTLSGAELTRVAGVSDPTGVTKRALDGDALFPDVVVYDPDVLDATPPHLVAGTGMSALDHAVELVYCDAGQPFTDAASISAIRRLVDHLPAAVAGDHDALGEVQVAAALSAFGVPNAGVGVNHAVVHVLGARYGVPHGAGNGIVLPHGMAFNRPAVADRQAMVAAAMGINTDGLSDREAAERAATAVSDLVSKLGLPERLRDVDVPEADLPYIAAEVLDDFTVDPNPRELTQEGVLEILERAY